MKRIDGRIDVKHVIDTLLRTDLSPEQAFVEACRYLGVKPTVQRRRRKVYTGPPRAWTGYKAKRRNPA